MQIMKRAVWLSRQNVESGKGGPFGAVIIKNGEVICEAVNQVTLLNDPTAHAEITAIRKACNILETFNLEGCEIYTSCEPCPMCLAAIYWAHIDRIYYAATRADAAHAGFEDAFLYEEICRPEGNRAVPSVHMPDEQAGQVIENWIKTGEKIMY